MDSIINVPLLTTGARIFVKYQNFTTYRVSGKCVKIVWNPGAWCKVYVQTQGPKERRNVMVSWWCSNGDQSLLGKLLQDIEHFSGNLACNCRRHFSLSAPCFIFFILSGLPSREIHTDVSWGNLQTAYMDRCCLNSSDIYPASVSCAWRWKCACLHPVGSWGCP